VHGHKRALRETALVLVIDMGHADITDGLSRFHGPDRVGDSCTDDGNRNVARELLHVLVDRYV
jgi:hypothetical protein